MFHSITALFIWVLLLVTTNGIITGAAKPVFDPAQVDRVHVVFSNHLDVGFKNTSTNIVNQYFTQYFPLAVNVTAEMRANGTDRYIWTTHSYLISLYLDCPIGFGLICPTPAQKASVEAAIQRGDITWHAFPFNAELEMLDPSLFKWGIQMTHDLDLKYGQSKKTVLSQRDVPGMTRAVIPHLVSSNITAVTVGVNGFSAPPQFPSAFTWADPVSGKSVLAMWHPGGYGGITAADAVTVDGWNTVLILDWKGDNEGPHTVDEAMADYKTIRQEFPNADVFASTFDAYVLELQTQQSHLKVYTEEVGDTWIYGISSDPYKLAAFRAIQRARSTCLESGDCQVEDPVMANFSRIFIKNSEHTWGGDIKIFLELYDNTTYYYDWSNQAFQKSLPSKAYQSFVGTWYEQRAWGLDYAIEAIPPSHPFYNYIEKALQPLEPQAVDTTGFKPVDPTITFNTSYYSFSFASDGSLSSLYDTTLSYQWVPPNHTIGQLVYQTFTEGDVNYFLEHYANCDYIKDCNWGYFDFGKVNVSNASPQTQTVTPTLVGLYQKGNIFLANVTFDAELSIKYGAPKYVILEWNFGDNIELVLHVFGKVPTRLPESMWLRFFPNVATSTHATPSTWTLSKLGSPINPTHIINNGSTHLHATESLTAYGLTLPLTPIIITSHDAPLATISSPISPFPTPLRVTVDQSQGVAYSLVNNIWGTNYVMWYPFDDSDADIIYRFTITTS